MFKTFAKKCVSINDDICRRLQKKGEKNEGLEQSCREAVQRARDAQAHADGATDALRKQLVISAH